MTGVVEAGTVIGLISGVISIIEATKTVYDAAKDAKGQPEAFRQVAARLPLVNDILQNAKERAQTLDGSAQDALRPILKSCNAKAEGLQKLFEKVVRKDDDKWYDRYKKALSTLGKGNKVECLMEGILTDIQVLACERLTGTVTNDQINELEEAIKEMNEMPPSLPEEAGSVNQTHSGSGDNIGVTAAGTMNQHKGSGDLYHNVISGGATFGSNPINPTFNIFGDQSHQTTSRDGQLLRDLRLTDPRDDKKRIEETKGGLLDDSYRWILNNPDFQRWHGNQQSRLLWITGDPGKGKTMLLCGIINELSKSMTKTDQLSYFFCQATDPLINNAMAVLRGLLYLLVNQQPCFVSHIQRKYDHAGKALFEDANAWVALSEIFKNILQDRSLNSTYFIVDALDECVTDLPKLLDFISLMSSISSRVKWIVSSRNEAYIEQRLWLDDFGIRLNLELNENAEQISHAINAYIDHCISELTEIQHDESLRDPVRAKMRRKANGTFLWVSLVIKELKDVMAWDVLEVLDEVPTELNAVYHRMLKQIKHLRRQDSERCRQILATIIATYRPLHLQELSVLSGLLPRSQNVTQATAKIVKMCGSFLTIREDNVYIIHQSAGDFLSGEVRYDLFPCGIGDVHYSIFTKSLQVMSNSLRRDMYNLRAPGYPAEQVKYPDPDPLAVSRYSCVYWLDHLHDANIANWSIYTNILKFFLFWLKILGLSGGTLLVSFLNKHSGFEDDLRDDGAVHIFLRDKYLYWLEALSLCKSMSKGVMLMEKLEILIQGRTDASALSELVRDARRFVLSHKWAIENYPLQAYTSALLFSPTRSLIRDLFKSEEPDWITIKPAMENWSPCLQTLEGHSGGVRSVAFSHDSAWLASASDDETIKIWVARSGECVRTLEGHSGGVSSVAFSHDSAQVASASFDNTVKIWDVNSSVCIQTLDHSDWVNSVAFSHDSALLASASHDDTVKIWDARSSKCIQTLVDHTHYVGSVAFSHDSTRIASGSVDDKIKIWDVGSGECLQTFKGHSNMVGSVAFSHNSGHLASASGDGTIKIWDASSEVCLQELKDHSNSVTAIALSPNLTKVVSASYDDTVKIWDTGSGECLQTHDVSGETIKSIALSSDSKWVVLGPESDSNIRILDASSGECVRMLEGHSNAATSIVLCPNSKQVASASYDNTVRIWDIITGQCLQTLSIGEIIFHISFDATGTYLHTEIGSFIIDASNASSISDTAPRVMSPKSSLSEGMALSSDGSWITYDSENLIWLPSEYRPSCSAVLGKTIGIGAGTGRVWICKSLV